MSIKIHPDFLERVEKFCKDNNILIIDRTFSNDLYIDINASSDGCYNLGKFIKILKMERDEYRQYKSFIWRMFN